MASAKNRKTRATTLNSKLIYKGSVFEVRQDTVLEPGGVRATRDVILHSGSVVVLPVLDDGRILLIRQYRYAVGGFLWELVAGRKEPGESPAAGARRELIEETGCTARRLRKILEIFPSPGFISERMWVFIATGLDQGAARPEADERITARAFSLAAADAMIHSGTLRDAKSVAGLLYYMRYIRRNRYSPLQNH